MRWKSEVKHAELTPARTWSKKDEGNFGGRSLLTPDLDSLAHYGVPGMRWGVKTKEYVKKGYDTLKRRQAILKMKRKAEAKAQYDEGYRLGQRAALNTHFVQKRVKIALDKKAAQNKQSFTDNAVDKGTDFLLKKSGLGKTIKDYGLDTYLPMAKNLLKNLKDKKLEDLYDTLKDEESRDKLVDTLNRFLSGRIVRGGARAIYESGRAVRRYAPDVGRAAGTAAKIGAKVAGAAVKSGYKWLRTGEPTGTQKIHNSVKAARQAISKYNRIATNSLNQGSQYVHRGAKSAGRQLDRLLTKRPRRRA